MKQGCKIPQYQEPTPRVCCFLVMLEFLGNKKIWSLCLDKIWVQHYLDWHKNSWYKHIQYMILHISKHVLIYENCICMWNMINICLYIYICVHMPYLRYIHVPLLSIGALLFKTAIHWASGIVMCPSLKGGDFTVEESRPVFFSSLAQV